QLQIHVVVDMQPSFLPSRTLRTVDLRRRLHGVVGLHGRIDSGEIGRLDEQARHCEEDERSKEIEPRRADVATTTPSEILARKSSRPKEKRDDRAPETSVEGDIASRCLARELAQRGQAQIGFLAAARAERAGHGRLAVAAARRLVCGGIRRGGGGRLDGAHGAILSSRRTPSASCTGRSEKLNSTHSCAASSATGIHEGTTNTSRGANANT